MLARLTEWTKSLSGASPKKQPPEPIDLGAAQPTLKPSQTAGLPRPISKSSTTYLTLSEKGDYLIEETTSDEESPASTPQRLRTPRTMRRIYFSPETGLDGEYVVVNNAPDHAEQKLSAAEARPPKKIPPLSSQYVTVDFLLGVLAHLPLDDSAEKRKGFLIATAVLIKLIEKGEYLKVDKWRLQNKGTPAAQQLKRVMHSTPIQSFWGKQLASPTSVPRILKQLASHPDSEHINHVLFALIHKGKFPIMAEWFVANQHTEEGKTLREKIASGLPLDKQPWYDLMADTKSVYLYDNRVPLKPHVLQGARMVGFRELHPFDMLLGGYCELKVRGQLNGKYGAYKTVPDFLDNALKNLADRNFVKLESHILSARSLLKNDDVVSSGLENLPELAAFLMAELSSTNALSNIVYFLNAARQAFDNRNLTELKTCLEQVYLWIEKQSGLHTDLKNLPMLMPSSNVDFLRIDFSIAERFEDLGLDFSRLEALIKIEKDKYEQKRDAYVSCGMWSNAMVCEFLLKTATDKLKKCVFKEKILVKEDGDFVLRVIMVIEDICQSMPSSVTYFHAAMLANYLTAYFSKFEEAELNNHRSLFGNQESDYRFSSQLSSYLSQKNIDDLQRYKTICFDHSDTSLRMFYKDLTIYYIELSARLFPYDDNIVSNTFQGDGFSGSIYMGNRPHITPLDFERELVNAGSQFVPERRAESCRKARTFIDTSLVKEPSPASPETPRVRLAMN